MSAGAWAGLLALVILFLVAWLGSERVDEVDPEDDEAPDEGEADV